MATQTRTTAPQQPTTHAEPQALERVETSTEVHALVPTTIDGAFQLARWLAGSSLLPKSVAREHDIFFIIQAGMELGLPPMAALRGLYVVHGRTALESKTKAALALQKGKAEYFRRIEYTKDATTWETKRRGDSEVVRMRYTLKEAQDAWLAPDPNAKPARPGKEGPWREYTQRMISHRALGWLCDDVYADVMMGVATAEDFDPKEFTFKPIGGGVEIATMPGAPAAERTQIAAVPADAKPANPTAPLPHVSEDLARAQLPPKEPERSTAPAAQPVPAELTSEDEIEDLITQIGKFSTRAELKAWSHDNIKKRVMSEAVRARLVKAYEDQCDMIDDAEKRDAAQKGR